MADVAEPLLDGRPHLLLDDVDVVVVEPGAQFNGNILARGSIQLTN